MAAYYTAYRIIDRKRKRNQISRKILKDLHNPFNVDEETFKGKFSLNQAGVHYLCELVKPVMKRNQGYPVEMQVQIKDFGYNTLSEIFSMRDDAFSVMVLSSLQVLTSGSFQNRVGEDQIMCVSQATISRSLDAFLEAILEIEPTIIEFPSLSELAFESSKLYGQSKISNIIGVIDCIPILIQKPHVQDYTIYLNSRKEYSINVQLVCDSDLKILDAVVHWPGSSPNSLIWKHCTLRNFLEENVALMPQRSFLLGNNCYPLEPWLLVPYDDCLKSEELIFNDHVYRALTVSQLCAATLKARFKCIHHNSGPLYYSPEKCSKIIAACIVLHNICIKMGITLCEPVDMEEDILHIPEFPMEEDEELEETMIGNEGMCVRDEVARHLVSL